MAVQPEMPPPWLTASTAFLNQLDSHDRHALIQLAPVTHFSKGSFIFKAGVEGEKIYLLESGRVKIARSSESGRETILWFCLPGEVFGLAGIPTVGPRIFYAQACTASAVRCISSDDFMQFLRGHPNVSIAVIHLLVGRLYSLSDLLLNATGEAAASRLQRALEHLRHQYGRKIGAETVIDFPITQQELADMIGTTRQTVSSLLNGMKHSGKLRVVGRKLYLPLA
ncbi:MAG TPA: Crp/Fnr family transcriptional regulator [Burkholderiales bacterium]|nr:Crp/Fnr family transcriptional regulator [Burkholderiales bacterium]